MSELLEDAFVALREENDGKSTEAAGTRRSILITTTGCRRRAAVSRFVLPLVAVLAASTAWAATGRILRTLAPHVEPAPPPPPRVPVSFVRTAEPISPPTSTLPLPPPTHVPRTRVAVEPSDEAPLYQAAHHAHFVSRDPLRALTAWNAYLAKHPRGRFAPEARYNRAIALVRLGRNEEAKEALQPFARGELAGYRQSEAKRLLESL